jgi:hypothetical protein
MDEKRCFHDGFPIEKGKPTFTFPVSMTPVETILSKLVFCDLSCVKAYLIFDACVHPNRLELFTMYVSKTYGINHITPSGERSILACYRHEGGITIKKFREQNQITTFGLTNKTTSQVIVNEEEVEELQISSKELDKQYKIDIATDRGNAVVTICGNEVQPQEKINSGFGKQHEDEEDEEDMVC